MPKFSKASLDKLSTCHPDLQKVFSKVIELYDCTIIEGHRDEAAQNAAVKAGNSTLKYPQGNHNKKPSLAVDAAPYPVRWNVEDPEVLKDWMMFIGIVIGVGHAMGIKIKSGIDWDQDRNFKEHKLVDFPHFELTR
jgi:peptidoglycan LD-endopeptidase CwlK